MENGIIKISSLLDIPGTNFQKILVGYASMGDDRLNDYLSLDPFTNKSILTLKLLYIYIYTTRFL